MTTRAAPQRLPDVITDAATGQRISLLDWQAGNVRASWALAAMVVAVLAVIGYALAWALEPGAATFFIAIAVLLAVGLNLSAYWFSDRLALAASRARPATREEHRYLVNVTEAVAIGTGVPTPRIFVIDSPVPNAFATGRDPQHGVVAVTTGLMQLLDRQELEAVVAHELAHIRNYDIRFASMLAATVGVVVLLRDIILRSMRFGGMRGGRGRSGGGKGQGLAMLALVLLLVFAPLLMTLLRLAVSRRREFLADATGAYVTRNPEGLARALEKLRDFSGARLEVSEGVQHMFFVNPVTRLNAHGLLATHPPIQDRINRLRRM
jgi:heat shock protein HtpX